VVKVRTNRKATAISLLIVFGKATWCLDDLLARRMAKPELVIVDGSMDLGAALASLWDDVPIQRCTVQKERNLFGSLPQAPARRDQGRVQTT
jgi:putative transposase